MALSLPAQQVLVLAAACRWGRRATQGGTPAAVVRVCTAVVRGVYSCGADVYSCGADAAWAEPQWPASNHLQRCKVSVVLKYFILLNV